ncbi:MAG: FadR family transcriptional regulator [Syntrophales bacterium]|nr:FadR family transcriptional regulator [Syntrophales bacterium]
MDQMLAPIRAKSLKEVFIERFEALILSGKLEVGQKLPSERELAEALGVSRPVVHEGLRDLEVRGMVTMKPRVGTVVNDYRLDGSLAILSSLLSHYSGELETKLLDSMFEMRILFETETVRLAALNRTEEQRQVFHRLIGEWDTVDMKDLDATADLYFRFHHHVAMASNNLFYPLLLNSFKNVYLSMARQSFIDAPVVPRVSSCHRRIATAVDAKDPEAAVAAMRDLILFGETHLKGLIEASGRNRGTLPPAP